MLTIGGKDCLVSKNQDNLSDFSSSGESIILGKKCRTKNKYAFRNCGQDAK